MCDLNFERLFCRRFFLLQKIGERAIWGKNGFGGRRERFAVVFQIIPRTIFAHSLWSGVIIILMQ